MPYDCPMMFSTKRANSLVLDCLFPRHLDRYFFTVCVMVSISRCGGGPPPDRTHAYELIDDSSDNNDPSILFATDQTPAEPNSYIVTFRSRASGNQLLFASYLDEFKFHTNLLNETIGPDERVKKYQFISAINLSPVDAKGRRFSDLSISANIRNLWESEPTEQLVGRMTRIDFADEESSHSFLNEMEQRGEILLAEPNYKSTLSGIFDEAAKNYTTAESSNNWMKSILLAEAMTDISKMDPSTRPTDDQINTSPPIVAVLDTGLDYEHKGLDGRVWTNNSIGAAGCSNDLHGCDTSNPDPGSLGNGNVYPCGTTGPSQALDPKVGECAHGTHVSGLIAGNFANCSPSGSLTATTCAGVCPMCQIMTLKVVEMNGNTPKVLDSAILTGMEYLNRFRRNGNSAVRIINSSFGKFSRSRSVGILVDILKRDGKGTLLIGAAGNEDSMSRVYPAAFSDAVAVSALDSSGQKAFFSNYGPWVDIAAPGDGLASTVPGNGNYAYKSGTSMACPVVAGALGLYLAVNPNATAESMRSLLLRTADGGIYAEDFADGYNNHYYFKKLSNESFRRPLLGAGQLNVQALMSGTANNAYLGAPVDRVSPGCGVLPGGAVSSSWILWLLIGLPAIFIRRKR